MASVKIFTLAVKTLAKPIANTIKAQATQHESFRKLCIELAQRMHRTEARMRMGLLNEESAKIKPLNDAKAIQNGAQTLSETFLFMVGAGLILGEAYRSSRKDTKRRDMVAEKLSTLEEEVEKLKNVEKAEVSVLEERSAGLERVLSTVIQNGMRQGWIDLGHKDSEINTLLHNLPGQPFALRRLDGSENDKLDTFSSSSVDSDDENPSSVLKEIRKVEPLNQGFAAMNAAAMGEMAKEHVNHASKPAPPARPARGAESTESKTLILEEDDDDTQRPS